jgi:hypothetical protein
VSNPSCATAPPGALWFQPTDAPCSGADFVLRPPPDHPAALDPPPLRAGATPLLLAYCALRCAARGPHASAAQRIADLATARRLRELAVGADAAAIAQAAILLARDPTRRDLSDLISAARRAAGLERAS